MVRKFVNIMQIILRNRVLQSALSVALLMTSTLWGIGSFEYCATSGLKNNWSATPLVWMLAVLVTPAICFALAVILVDMRRRSPFSSLGWCALGVASHPGHPRHVVGGMVG